MKFLRNPIVTGALVLVAVAFMGYQLRPLFRGHGRSTSPAPSGATAPAPTPPAAARAQAAPAPARLAEVPSSRASGGIDRDFVALHFPNWAQAGRRDPFLLQPALASQKVATNASSVSKWKLKAIWRQTDSRVAAINNGIYREGDVIEGYKILRIEEDVVWFQNPDSLDHLEFRSGAPAIANAAKPEKTLRQ